MTVVTVTKLIENPHNDGMWAVMADNLCWNRFETEAKAEVYAEEVRRMIALTNWVEELMDRVEEDLVLEFELSTDAVRQAMQEYFL